MIAACVMAAALAAGYEPVTPPDPVYQIPGPAFLMPCKVDRAAEVARVQIWVSADRGKTWTMDAEFTPDTASYTYTAKRPGEYWFAPRLQKKDKTFLPADVKNLVPQCRVAVATGTESDALAKPGMSAAASELDDELTRIELDLIRKEMKRLTDEKGLTPDVETKIDRLRQRLREVRNRLDQSELDSLRPRPALPPLPAPSDSLPPPAAEADPLVIPAAPVPVRPAAPPPRVPVTTW